MTEIKVDIFDYVIKNYSDELVLKDNEEYKTLSIGDDIDKDTCELIEVIDESEKGDNIIRSCDIIKSKIKRYKSNASPTEIPLISKDSNLYFELNYSGGTLSSDDLIKFTNINGAKKASFSSINLDKIPENIKKLYNYSNVKTITNDTLDILKKEYPNSGKHGKNKTFIRWLSPKKGDNIVLFGDIHGSFSTLIRHLLRFRKLGIINKEGSIRSGYSIIFLGDLVDRGVYSFETLMILYLLKINNKSNIIINRGNHEELETNLYYKLKEELNHKLKNHGESVFNIVNAIMTWQPSAVVLQNSFNEKEYVYLAHGGLPHDFENNDQLPQVFIEGIKEKKSFMIDDEHGRGIRWNDIYGKDKTIDNLTRINPRNDPNITPENTDAFKTIKITGTNLIRSAHDIGIKMIIRGHQDSYHNTKIIGPDDAEWFSIKEYTVQKNKKDMKCRGSIYTVSLLNDKMIINNDPDDSFEMLPVLTISTNTDKDRNLTSDSYAILQFTDENEFVDKCFAGGCIDKKNFYKYNSKLLELFGKA